MRALLAGSALAVLAVAAFAAFAATGLAAETVKSQPATDRRVHVAMARAGRARELGGSDRCRMDFSARRYLNFVGNWASMPLLRISATICMWSIAWS